MPKVAPVSIGTNVTLIRGLTERARSVEARRNNLHLSTAGGTVTVPAAATWAYPQGWPSLQIVVGSSGAAWTMFGAADAGVACLLGVGVDGAQPSQATGPSRSTAFNSGCFGGIGGLTPGWHTLTLWVQGNGGTNATASVPWLIGWGF